MLKKQNFKEQNRNVNNHRIKSKTNEHFLHKKYDD